MLVPAHQIEEWPSITPQALWTSELVPLESPRVKGLYKANSEQSTHPTQICINTHTQISCVVSLTCARCAVLKRAIGEGVRREREMVGEGHASKVHAVLVWQSK